jgi:hypothetical protein
MNIRKSIVGGHRSAALPKAERKEEETESLPDDLRRKLLARQCGAIVRRLDSRGVTEKKITRDFQAWRKACSRGC